MWSKIYILLLSLSIFLLGFVTFYSWTWLRSIGLPIDAIAGFEYFDNIGWTLLWVTAILLLVVANIILVKTERAWAMWTTFAYFAVFVIAKYFWLAVAATNFQRDNNLPSNNYLLGPFFALFLCIAFGAIVFVDQLLVVRLSRTIYPPELPVADIDEVILEENEIINEENKV